MFASKGSIYTVHVNDDASDVADRVVLVREGFAFWAFALNIVWLLAHRLWIASVLYVALLVLLVRTAELAGLGEPTIAIVQLGLQFALGTFAHDAQREALARRGYQEVDVVCAESELLAERRYYDRHAHSHH